jgi:ADP-ribosylglycohydrolase
VLNKSKEKKVFFLHSMEKIKRRIKRVLIGTHEHVAAVASSFVICSGVKFCYRGRHKEREICNQNEGKNCWFRNQKEKKERKERKLKLIRLEKSKI